MIWQVTNAVVTVNKKKEEEENLFIYLCLWVKLFGEEEGRNGRPELDSLFQNRTDATSTNQQKKKKKKKNRTRCESSAKTSNCVFPLHHRWRFDIQLKLLALIRSGTTDHEAGHHLLDCGKFHFYFLF